MVDVKLDSLEAIFNFVAVARKDLALSKSLHFLERFHIRVVVVNYGSRVAEDIVSAERKNKNSAHEYFIPLETEPTWQTWLT